MTRPLEVSDPYSPVPLQLVQCGCPGKFAQGVEEPEVNPNFSQSVFCLPVWGLNTLQRLLQRWALLGRREPVSVWDSGALLGHYRPVSGDTGSETGSGQGG